MATIRLRRTFHYPSDSDDPPDLDEEHQETLLQDLETTDQKTSTLYRRLFLAVPVLTVLHSMLNLNINHNPAGPDTSTAASLFLTLLQITVPVLAAWILHRHPITVPAENQGLIKSLYASSSSSGKSTQQTETAKSNARRLTNLGLGLSAVLAIAAGAKWSSMTAAASPAVQAGIRSIDGEWSEIGSLLLPAVIFFLALFVRQQLAPVDMQELREARYELKGA